jgi:dihydrofolate reductase
MGRKSFDLSKKHEGQNPWKGMTTYVFSRSLKEVSQGVKLVQGDIKKEVNIILQQPGKDIWLFGGAELTVGLLKEGLVDELWLSVHPVLLGGGKPLFQGLELRTKLKLITTRAYDTGLVSLIYQIEK